MSQLNKRLNLFLWMMMLASLPASLFANDNLRLGDIRSLGSGGNGVVSSPLLNPAMLAFSERMSMQINYFNRYGLKELGTVDGSFILPNNTVSAGLHISSFGYEAYRESMFRLLLGRKLSERFTLGVSFQYAMIQTEIYDNVQPARIATDIGMTYSLLDNLLVGLLIMNCPSVYIGAEYAGRKEFLLPRFHAGTNLALNDEINMSVSADLETFSNINFNMGIEYEPFENFFLRAGMKSIPASPSFGIGYTYLQFTIDIASVFDPVLGMSTGCGLSYSF